MLITAAQLLIGLGLLAIKGLALLLMVLGAMDVYSTIKGESK